MADAKIHETVLKPFRAQVRGDIVHFQPGDTIPAEVADEWGRARNHMREMGLIAPLPVPTDEWIFAEAERRGLLRGATGGRRAAAEGTAAAAPVDPKVAEELDKIDDETAADATFPRHLGGGLYELSDGARVRGRAAALSAQAELGD